MVVALAMTLGSLSAGCSGDPYATRYTRNKPAPEAVAGTWTASDGGQATLALRSHGTFTLQGASPDWVLNVVAVKPGGVTAAGEWSLVRRQEWWVIELRITEVDGTRRDVFNHVILLGQQAPYECRYVLGDPDGGMGVPLKRTAAGG